MVEGVVGLVVGSVAGALVSTGVVVAFRVVSGVVRGKNLGTEGTNFGFFRYFLFFRGLLSGVRRKTVGHLLCYYCSIVASLSTRELE
jgi:hypothetical protein